MKKTTAKLKNSNANPSVENNAFAEIEFRRETKVIGKEVVEGINTGMFFEFRIGQQTRGNINYNKDPLSREEGRKSDWPGKSFLDTLKKIEKKFKRTSIVVNRNNNNSSILTTDIYRCKVLGGWEV